MKLPAGTYEVTAEHETLGKQEMMVTVAENGSADLNFTFKPQSLIHVTQRSRCGLAS